MALSFDTYTGDAATTNFSVTFEYISQTHVKVYLDGVLQTLTTHYTWFNATTIQFVAAPGSGVVVRIERETPNTARLVDFQDAGNLTEYDLDTNSNQVFFLVQETVDGFDAEAMKLAADNKWDAESKVIKNLADPVSDQDAVTKLWANTNAASTLAGAIAAQTAAETAQTGAETAETNAAASASAAATSAGTASAQAASATASASAASTSETNAATSETNAATSETNAATSHGYASDWAIKTSGIVNDGVDTDYSSKSYSIGSAAQNPYGSSKRWATEVEDTYVVGTDYSALHWAAKASASAAAAAASYDSFDDRYLGTKASAPTLDNDGNALLTGALYWNTTSTDMWVYNGSAWENVSTDPNSHYTKVAADAKFANPNMLYNPDFTLWKRGTTSVAHPSSDYVADRWFCAHTGSMVYTVSKQTATGAYDFRHYHRVDVTTVDTSLAAGDFGHFTQKLEGLDINHLNWGETTAQDVTLSFWHRHTKTGTHSVSIRNAAGTRCYIKEYTQSVTNAWEYAEVTFPGETSGTWADDTSTGLALSFAMASGTTFAAAADTWHTSGNYFASTNQVNNFDNVNNVFDIAHVKLELGDSATVFIARPYQEEVMLCKRYYQQVKGAKALASGNMQSSTSGQCMLHLPVGLRTSPTLTLTASDFRVRDGAANNITPSAITVSSNELNGTVLEVTVSGGVQYQAFCLRDTSSNGIELDAEL